MGGLSKKSFLVKGLSADPQNPAILINSGNMLFKKGVSAAEMPAARIGAETILAATRAMEGRVMGIGDLDLAAGLPLLRSAHRPPEFSLLALNLVKAGTNAPLFAAASWQKAGELHVAILGLTDHSLVTSGEGFQVLPWQQCLEQAVAEVKGKADFILLLSNYSLAENQEIARKIPAIDCILQSGHVLGNMQPTVVKNTLISQTEIRGKYVGVLDIDWNGHGRWREGTTASASGEAASTYRNRFEALKLSLRNDPQVEALVKDAQRRLAKGTLPQ